MSRNPHATNLRHHRQQIVQDKREAELRHEFEALLRAALDEPKDQPDEH